MRQQLSNHKDSADVAEELGHVRAPALLTLGPGRMMHVPIARNAMEMQRRVDGKQPSSDFPDRQFEVAACLTGSGKNTLDKHEPAQALAALQESLDFQEKAAGTRETADYSFTLNTIGLCQHALGDEPKALAAYQEALKIQQTLTKGEDDVSIAVTMDNVAEALANLGRPAEELPVREAGVGDERRSSPKGRDDADAVLIETADRVLP